MAVSEGDDLVVTLGILCCVHQSIKAQECVHGAQFAQMVPAMVVKLNPRANVTLAIMGIHACGLVPWILPMLQCTGTAPMSSADSPSRCSSTPMARS